MRIVVTGGREYADRAKLFRELDALHAAHPITELVEGGQTGADTLAGEWADDRGVTRTTDKGEWTRYGKSAGPIRNGKMLDRSPALVVAFPGNVGTANCVKQARLRGIRVIEVSA